MLFDIDGQPKQYIESRTIIIKLDHILWIF